jgi:chromosomal replication initiation ATPase DnaA
MEYYQELIGAHYCGRRHLKQIISEHAAFMCQLVHADRRKDTKELMSIWAKVELLNVEWATLIANEREFKEVTLRLIRRYSDALKDLIIDHRPPHDLEEIIDLETRFYSKLARITPDADEMRAYWALYTHSVLQMASNKPFANAAQRCIEKGELLGTWLDSYLN